MAVRKQLTVAWQNRPGELANVCRVLAEVGVNIEALATAEAGEYGAVRLLVDDVDRARQVFHDAQVAHTTIDVFVIVFPNKAGALADVAGRLSAEKINIEYFYSAVAPGVERALGVFKVSDPHRADEITHEMADAVD
ncbi:MAG: hypothetical protein IH849_04105 [Acidobacteria bacterium]|nr:hypothetical protein [Acidobacteriota bacterium]